MSMSRAIQEQERQSPNRSLGVESLARFKLRGSKVQGQDSDKPHNRNQTPSPKPRTLKPSPDEDSSLQMPSLAASCCF